MNPIRTIKLALWAVAIAGFCTSMPGQAAEQKNVSHWIASARKVGSAAKTLPVHFSLFLGFKDQPELKRLIAAQSTPGSPLYGKFLTPEAFRARFAPDAAKVALVQETLKKLGFKIEYTPKSGLFVQAAGTAGQVRLAFGVTQDIYAYKGRMLRANAETPHLPARIAGIVTYIAGLDDTAALRKPDFVRAAADDAAPARAARLALPRNRMAVTPNAAPPVQGGIGDPFCSIYWGDHIATLTATPGFYPRILPWEICGYTPQQLRQAYGATKVTQTGKGVRVGIVDVYASPTIAQDANLYSARHGLPPLTGLNFQQVVPAGLTDVPANDPCDPQDWYEEETLDVEAVHAMAPNATIIFAGIACTDPGNAALYGFIDNHTADIVTNSYSFNGESLPPDFIDAENQYFMQAAAEGMSILFSTGDNGDLAASNGIASGAFEATSPYVTAVGGTSLALADKNGKKSEWGWGSYRTLLDNATVSANGKTVQTTGVSTPFDFYAGSGGGPSLAFAAPDYQSNVAPYFSGYTRLENLSQVRLNTPHRVVPDIAMAADPYTGFVDGETFTKANDPALDAPCLSLSATTEYCEFPIGGTSLASPLFAGVLALVDQARFGRAKPAVGFVNPLLYSLTVGAPGTTASPIVDVRAPSKPTAVVRGFAGIPNTVRVVTIDSKVNPKNTFVIEGRDTTYKTRDGYDEVTGLGTPYIPALIRDAAAAR